MKTIKLLIVSILLLFTTLAVAQDKATAWVTLKFDQITLEQYNDIATRMGKDNNSNVEYYCLESGVLVIKLQEIGVQEKADVKLIVARKVKSKLVTTYKVIDIHLKKNAGVTKC